MISSWFASSLFGFLLKECVCPALFEVLNCWLNLVASCLDYVNELPLKVIASFSAWRFARPSNPLIVVPSLVRSVFWSMVSTKSLHIVRLCTQMRFWMSVSNLGSSCEVGSLYGGCYCLPTPLTLVCGGSPIIPLLVHHKSMGDNEGVAEEMMCVVLQRGNCGDGCDLASTLCKYDLRNENLFV